MGKSTLGKELLPQLAEKMDFGFHCVHGDIMWNEVMERNDYKKKHSLIEAFGISVPETISDIGEALKN